MIGCPFSTAFDLIWFDVNVAAPDLCLICTSWVKLFQNLLMALSSLMIKAIDGSSAGMLRYAPLQNAPLFSSVFQQQGLRFGGKNTTALQQKRCWRSYSHRLRSFSFGISATVIVFCCAVFDRMEGRQVSLKKRSANRCIPFRNRKYCRFRASTKWYIQLSQQCRARSGGGRVSKIPVEANQGKLVRSTEFW